MISEVVRSIIITSINIVRLSFLGDNYVWVGGADLAARTLRGRESSAAPLRVNTALFGGSYYACTVNICPKVGYGLRLIAPILYDKNGGISATPLRKMESTDNLKYKYLWNTQE